MRCANRLCRQSLDSDHVVVITSRHLRRFCTIECIGEGQEADQDFIYQLAGRDRDREAAHEEWKVLADRLA